MARWIWSPLDLLEDCARRYGDYFTVRVPGMPPNVVFSDPQAVRDLFTASPDAARLGDISRLLKPVLGDNSVMILDGARHRRERKLMLPPFHGERMRAYGGAMRQAARDAVARWGVGQTVRMLDEMHAMTLEVILQTIIGVREGVDLAEMRAAVTRFLTLGTSALATALLWAVPTDHVDAVVYRPVDGVRVGPLRLPVGRLLPWRALVLAQRRLDQMFYAEFAARRGRAGATDGQDVLSLLMSVRDDEGRGMSDAELRDEMVTLLLAGHETTATTLAWAVYHLLRKPAALARLRDELRAGGADDADPEAVTRNEYLDAVLKETMRLSPVALVVGRRLVAPMRLGRWDLPAGVNALACVYLSQRRADLWERPNEFVPERWLGAKTDPYQFFPFGGGSRRCLGMAFAYHEMKIVLAELVSRTRLRLADDRPIRVQRKSITFAPSRGLPVVVEEILAPAAG